MPIDPDFNQYDFDISTDNHKYSKKLVQDIQNSWSAKTRERINIVKFASESKGQIYAIKFNESSVPKVGGYTDSLAQHGWGYFTYSEDTLYVGRVIPSTDPNKEYVFEGRENVQFDTSSIRQFNNVELDFDKDKYSDEKQDMSLIDDIMSAWPTETLKYINHIGQNSSSNSYCVLTDDYNMCDKNSTGCNTVPLGKHVDVLLHNGWAVQAIKSNKLSIAELQILIDSHDSEYVYKFDNTENVEKGISVYTPKECKLCEDHEHYGHLVTDTEGFDDDLPVTKRACLDCMKNSEYPTSKEFRNNESVNIPN